MPAASAFGPGSTRPCPHEQGAWALLCVSGGAVEGADGGKPTSSAGSAGGQRRWLGVDAPMPHEQGAWALLCVSGGAVEGADGGKPTSRGLPPSKCVVGAGLGSGGSAGGQWPAVPAASAVGSGSTRPCPMSRGHGCFFAFLAGRWRVQTAASPRAVPAVPAASAFGSGSTRPCPTSRGHGRFFAFLMGRWRAQTAASPRAGACRLRWFLGEGAAFYRGTFKGYWPQPTMVMVARGTPVALWGKLAAPLLTRLIQLPAAARNDRLAAETGRAARAVELHRRLALAKARAVQPQAHHGVRLRKRRGR